jgi:hypothetical protein
MDFVGRYDDQRILFCDEYLWLVPLDSEKGDTIEFPISKFPAPKTNCDNSFYIYGSLCGFGISLFRKIYHLYAYVHLLQEFSGMWLMAKRKVENWIFWIIDVISIPLYFSKGFTFTSFQYIVFTIVAIFYLEWKKTLDSSQTTKIIKIALFGPESTGKTTLARQEYYKTEWVPEYAREYLQKNGIKPANMYC